MSRILTNTNWPEFASTIAAPSKPDEYNAAALARLMVHLRPYVVEVKNLRFKFHARNKIQLISFSNDDERNAYNKAWEDYLKKCAEIEGRDMPGGKFMLLVQFLKFRQAAELIRAPWLARRLYQIVNNDNKSGICACNFKHTISKITKHLVLDYGVSRDEVSLIWGGMDDKPVKKRKIVSKEKLDKLKELIGEMDEEDVDFLKELGIETDVATLKDTSPEEEYQKNALRSENELLRLGKQGKIARQDEIDKFQSGKSKYCIFTFKSGGVGLSLHHDDEKHRQRETILAPTYSAIELVQGLGRAHRITSISDTIQTIVFYRETIEEHVASKVSQKLRCLKEVVRTRESWEDVIIGSAGKRAEVDENVEVEGDDINNIESEDEE